MIALIVITVLSVVVACAFFFRWMSADRDNYHYRNQIRSLFTKQAELENTIRNLRDGIERLAAVAGCFNERGE